MLGDRRGNDLTPATLERWASERMTEGYARGTVKAWLNYLSAALTRARKLAPPA